MSSSLSLERRATLAVEEPTTHAVGLQRPAEQFAARLKAQQFLYTAVVENLEKNIDFGELPSGDDDYKKKGDKTPPKYMLLKPGADRICAALGAQPRFSIVEQSIDHDRRTPYTKRKKVWRDGANGKRAFDWKEESGESLGFYRFVVRCEIVSHETGLVLGEDVAVCSSLEGKYVDRPRESENTILQMAQKRAQSAAVLRATGLSGRFAGEGEPVTDADEDGVVKDAQDGITLAQALAYQLNKVPLETMTPRALRSARTWCDGKLQDAPEDAKLLRASAMIDMVIKHRETTPLAQKDEAAPAPTPAPPSPPAATGDDVGLADDEDDDALGLPF
jgi:hypothetical protein